MDPIIGEIKLWPLNWAPEGWAFCDGSLMAISQNPPLYSLLGTLYGGDGKVTFALPNLNGRVPVGADKTTADKTTLGKVLGDVRQEIGAGPIATKTVSVTGTTGTGSVPVPIAPLDVKVNIPTLGLNFIIATTGIYPQRP